MFIKNMIRAVSLVLFMSTISIAEEGAFRVGLEGGLSPVDLEAEKTAQEIANLSGSTVTTEYDTGALVLRLFADYGITSNLKGEVGIFQTSSVDATYSIGSDSATESYDASGFDISGKYYVDDFYAKVGMHSSTLSGAASVTIASTTYGVTAESQDTGALFGAGFEIDNTFFSVTRYSDIGGVSDFTFFSAGLLF